MRAVLHLRVDGKVDKTRYLPPHPDRMTVRGRAAAV